MKLESKTETYQSTHHTLRLTREENDRLVAAIASALVGPDKRMVDVSRAEPLVRSITVEVQWLDKRTDDVHLTPVSGADSYWWQRKKMWGASTTLAVLLEGEEERIREERRT